MSFISSSKSGNKPNSAGGERDEMELTSRKTSTWTSVSNCADKQTCETKKILTSRGRPIKLYETEPFLSVDLLPYNKVCVSPETSVMSEKPRVGRSMLRSQTCLTSPLHIQNITSSLSQRSSPSISTTQTGKSLHKSLEHTSSNLHIKNPFKHSINQPPPSPASVDQSANPSRLMKARTKLATSHINRVLLSQRDKEDIRVKGRLLKGKLKPMYPVNTNGPTMQHCRGVISDIASYASSPSRTLQRRRRILSNYNQGNNIQSLVDRPVTVESIHQTSEVSSIEGNLRDQTCEISSIEGNLENVICDITQNITEPVIENMSDIYISTSPPAIIQETKKPASQSEQLPVKDKPDFASSPRNKDSIISCSQSLEKSLEKNVRISDPVQHFVEDKNNSNAENSQIPDKNNQVDIEHANLPKIFSGFDEGDLIASDSLKYSENDLMNNEDKHRLSQTIHKTQCLTKSENINYKANVGRRQERQTSNVSESDQKTRPFSAIILRDDIKLDSTFVRPKSACNLKNKKSPPKSVRFADDLTHDPPMKNNNWTRSRSPTNHLTLNISYKEPENVPNNDLKSIFKYIHNPDNSNHDICPDNNNGKEVVEAMEKSQMKSSCRPWDDESHRHQDQPDDDEKENLSPPKSASNLAKREKSSMRNVSSQKGNQKGTQNGNQIGDNNLGDGSQIGAQDGNQIGAQDGNQKGAQDGKQIVAQDGNQKGAQDGKQIGAQDGKQIGAQDGKQIGAQDGKQIGAQDGKQIGDNNLGNGSQCLTVDDRVQELYENGIIDVDVISSCISDRCYQADISAFSSDDAALPHAEMKNTEAYKRQNEKIILPNIGFLEQLVETADQEALDAVRRANSPFNPLVETADQHVLFVTDSDFVNNPFYLSIDEAEFIEDICDITSKDSPVYMIDPEFNKHLPSMEAGSCRRIYDRFEHKRVKHSKRPKSAGNLRRSPVRQLPKRPTSAGPDFRKKLFGEYCGMCKHQKTYCRCKLRKHSASLENINSNAWKQSTENISGKTLKETTENINFKTSIQTTENISGKTSIQTTGDLNPNPSKIVTKKELKLQKTKPHHPKSESKQTMNKVVSQTDGDDLYIPDPAVHETVDIDTFAVSFVGGSTFEALESQLRAIQEDLRHQIGVEEEKLKKVEFSEISDSEFSESDSDEQVLPDYESLLDFYRKKCWDQGRSCLVLSKHIMANSKQNVASPFNYLNNIYKSAVKEKNSTDKDTGGLVTDLNSLVSGCFLQRFNEFLPEADTEKEKQKATVKKNEKLRRDSESSLHSLEVIATRKSIFSPTGSKIEDENYQAVPFPPLCFTVNSCPPQNLVYYFAYGTDMNASRFGLYIKREVEVKRWGILFGFNMLFNKKGVEEAGFGFPNIEFNPFCSVEGCVYELTSNELQLLDSCVGYPEHYEHIVVPVWMTGITEKTPDGDDDANDDCLAQYCVPAVTYIAHDKWVESEKILPCDYSVSQCLKDSDLLSPLYVQHLKKMAEISQF